MSRSVQRLIPFLLTLGPIWLVLFAGSNTVMLRLAGLIGAIGLSLGLVLFLTTFYAMQRKIEALEILLNKHMESSGLERETNT